MAEYLDYNGLTYYHGKLSDELSDKQTQIDANTQSISSLSSTVISHTNSISALQNGKVDKVTGKGLSTNDFTNTYKAILDGGFDYVPYELVSGGSVDLDTLLLSRSDPPKKVYYCPQTTTLIRNFPTANNRIYGAFILEVSKTSQSQTEEKVTLVQKLYFFPSTGFETITAAYGYYTRSRGWTTNPTASLAWTAWERDKAAETAVSAERVKQDYISGADYDYPVLASGDYSLTQGSITGTPFKMHGLKYNPKTGTLTANKFTGELNGNASTATTARSATEADHATSADSATESTLTTALKTALIVVSPTVTSAEGWYQLAEWDIADVPSTYYFGYNILFLINGSKSYTTYGNALIKVICYGAKKNVGDATKIANRLHLMSSTRVAGAEIAFTESMFKLTYKMDSTTKNITYKLWWHKDPTWLTQSERFSISLVVANDGETPVHKNIADKINLISYPTINYQIGTEGYLENDPEVLAVDCAVADVYNPAMSANQLKLNVASTTANANCPILCAPSAYPTTALIQGVYKTEVTYNPSTNTLNVGNISGNAATATKLSGPQTVLYESTTATTSFTLSGLFANWSAVMIYLTGEWVSGTSGTHGFFVPLKHLKDRGNGGIEDFCGGKVIHFLYVDDDSMRWFEYQGQGTMSYSSVKVVGLY